MSAREQFVINYYIVDRGYFLIMSGSDGSWKKVLVVVLVVVVVFSVVLLVFDFFPKDEVGSRFLVDSENDVFVSVGDFSPGFVDLSSASVELVGDELVLVVSTREPVVGLGEGEFCDFVVLVVLEDESDVIWSFELDFEFNSTGMFGFVSDLELDEVRVQEFVQSNNDLIIY